MTQENSRCGAPQRGFATPPVEPGLGAVTDV